MATNLQWDPVLEIWVTITTRDRLTVPLVPSPAAPGRPSNQDILDWWDVTPPRFPRLEGMVVHEEYLARREEVDLVRIEAYQEGYNDALLANLLPPLPGMG